MEEKILVNGMEIPNDVIDSVKKKLHYDKHIPGNMIKREIMETPASKRELLDTEKLTNKQKKELERCGTLCWECGHALDIGCRWFLHQKPVNGWIAIPSTIHPKSFTVIDCPEYILTVRKKPENSVLKYYQDRAARRRRAKAEDEDLKEPENILEISLSEDDRAVI